MYIYINYLRPDRVKGRYLAKNVRVDSENANLIHFDWTIGNEISIAEGSIAFLICALQTDSEGNEELHWNSEINTQMYVSDGLECTDVITNEYPDIINDLLYRMDNVIAANTAILDTTLTQKGLAADAKATGDAIAKFNDQMDEEVSERQAMFDSIREDLEEMDKRFTKVTLYDNPDGILGSFTLSDNKDNYNELEVEYGFVDNDSNQVYKRERISVIPGKQQAMQLDTLYWYTTDITRLNHMILNFNGTNVNVGHRRGFTVDAITDATDEVSDINSAQIYIYKVYGINLIGEGTGVDIDTLVGLQHTLDDQQAILDEQQTTINKHEETLNSLSTEVNTNLENQNGILEGLLTDLDDIEAEGNNVNLQETAKAPLTIIPSGYAEYENEIREGYNLFNTHDFETKTVSGVTISQNEDGSFNATGTCTGNYVVFKNQINITDILEDGETYTIWSNQGSSLLYAQIQAVKADGSGTDYYTTMTSESYKSLTINKTTYSKYTINIQSGSTSNGAVYDLKNIFFMLYKGTYDSTKQYEKYGQTPSPLIPNKPQTLTGNQQIYVLNKNFYDASKLESLTNLGMTFTPTETGFTYQGTPERAYVQSTRFYNYIPKGSYVISNKSSIDMFIWFYDESDTVIRSVATIKTNKPASVTLDKDCKKLQIGIENLTVGNTYSGEISDIQIELGSITTEPIINENQLYNLYLGDLEFIKIANYDDYIRKVNNKWCKRKHIDKVQLTAAGTSATGAVNDDIARFFYVDNYRKLSDNGSDIFVLSDSFIPMSIDDYWIDTKGYIEGIAGNDDNTAIFFRIKKETIGGDTVDLCNTYLAENPTYVYYVLATPIDEEITDPILIEQLDALEKATSYKYVTNIIGAYFKVVAKKSNDIRVDDIEVKMDNLETQMGDVSALLDLLNGEVI